MCNIDRQIILREWQEAIGYLVDIKDDFIFFRSFTVLIYPQDKEIIKQLTEMKGKRVSILKTDIKNKTYLVRVNLEPNLGQW